MFLFIESICMLGINVLWKVIWSKNLLIYMIEIVLLCKFYFHSNDE